MPLRTYSPTHSAHFGARHTQILWQPNAVKSTYVSNCTSQIGNETVSDTAMVILGQIYILRHGSKIRVENVSNRPPEALYKYHLENTKIVFYRSCAPDPAGELTSSLRPLAGWEGDTPPHFHPLNSFTISVSAPRTREPWRRHWKVDRQNLAKSAVWECGNKQQNINHNSRRVSQKQNLRRSAISPQGRRQGTHLAGDYSQ